MAFGIPGSETGGGENGEFLGRIQYDARVGFWKVVNRIQTSEGAWTNEEGQPFRDPSFLMDMGSLEVGYIKLTSPPSFLLVPYGQPIPPQPQELGDNKRKAFLPGFRVKVMSPKTFGDKAPRYFSASSKTVLAPMEALWMEFAASPEAAAGKIPGIKVTGTTTIEIKTPEGTSRFYAPVFQIAGWQDRPEAFGPRTVPAPSASTVAPTPPAARPANHVPPPTPKAAEPVLTDDSMPF